MQLGSRNTLAARGKLQKARKVKLLLPLAACHLLLASCRLSPPQAPRWDAKINLPLINHNYSMQELIDKQDNLYADNLGLVHFVSESELDSFTVGDRLALGAFSKSFVTTLGQYTIPSPGSVSAEISLRQIYPASVDLAGQTAPIPAFTFELPIAALPDFENYFWVEVSDGTLTIHLRNGLPVPLGPPLHFEILEGSNHTPIAAFDHDDEMPPGGEMTRSLDWAGKVFPNNLAFLISGRSPGSRGNAVFIDPNSELQLTLTLSALQVSRAFARIGPQMFSDTGDIALGDSLAIVSADIKKGAVSVAVAGDFPVSSWVVVTLPDFRSPQNVVATDSLMLGTNGSSNLSFDLAGYRFRPLPAAFGEQKVRFQWQIRTTNGPDEFVSIASGDKLQATFSNSRIVFAKINGGFNPKTIEVKLKKLKLDLPDGLDSLKLADVSLEVTLLNGINFPISTDFRVEGIGESGKVVHLDVRKRINAGKANGTPVESRITLNQGNSNIKQFFNALPKSINFRGKVTVGEPGYVGNIRDQDMVSGKLRFDAPLAFILPAQHAESDVEVIKISGSVREQLAKNRHSGKIVCRLTNHLPLGATIALHLARKESAVFAAPDLVVGPIRLAAPTIDPAAGRVVLAAPSTVEIALTEEQLQLFQKSPLHLGVLFDLPGTGGSLVRVFASDYIDVQALAEIDFTVDGRKSR
jgi:hypothetical protein